MSNVTNNSQKNNFENNIQEHTIQNQSPVKIVSIPKGNFRQNYTTNKKNNTKTNMNPIVTDNKLETFKQVITKTEETVITSKTDEEKKTTSRKISSASSEEDTSKTQSSTTLPKQLFGDGVCNFFKKYLADPIRKFNKSTQEFKRNHRVLRILGYIPGNALLLAGLGITTILSPVFYFLKATLWNTGKLLFAKNYGFKEFREESLLDLKRVFVVPLNLALLTLGHGCITVADALLAIPRIFSLPFTDKLDRACARTFFQDIGYDPNKSREQYKLEDLGEILVEKVTD